MPSAGRRAKGHASWSHIITNSTNASAVGNGQADLAADRAVDASEWQQVQEGLHYHARKQRAYIALVTRLQTHAGKLLIKVRELCDEAGVRHQGRYSPPIVVDAPPARVRICFTQGSSLGLSPLPPALEDKMASLHLFLNCTRWRLDPTSKPTTWLEIYAAYRLMGGGIRDDDPNSPPTYLTKELSSFVRNCKQIIAITGNPQASLLLKGLSVKGFPLEEYGILKHMPAVRAELCLSEGHASLMHSMLCSIRLIKGGADKGSLKASALPLPRVEPWSSILRQVPPTLPELLENRRSRLHQAIETKGERGDGRGTKPMIFMLDCPSCGHAKDCAKHQLYVTSARCVTCRHCLRNASSLRWRCSHGLPWHTCLHHRETGFWCGRAPAEASHKSRKRPATHLASASLLAKRRKLGSLGDDTQRVTTSVNSATSPAKELEKKQKKNE